MLETTTRVIPVEKIHFLPEGKGVRPAPKPEDKDWYKVVDIQRDMERQGQLQPPLVKDNEDGTFVVIDGATRVTAAKTSVAEGNSRFAEGMVCLVTNAKEEDFLAVSFTANYHRRQTTKMQEIQALRRMIYTGASTIEKLSEKVGVSQSRLNQLLKIGNLPEEIQDLVEKGDITLQNAITMQKLPMDAINGDILVDAQTMKGDDFLARVATELEEIKKDRKNTPAAPKVFTPTAQYMKKGDAEDLLQQYRFKVKESGEEVTEFDRGSLFMIEKIFGLDEETLAFREKAFVADQQEKEAARKERAEKRASEKKKSVVASAIKAGYAVIDPNTGEPITVDADEDAPAV